MIRNEELFHKYMKFARKMRMPFMPEGKEHFGPMFEGGPGPHGRGHMPPPPPFEGPRPPFGPDGCMKDFGARGRAIGRERLLVILSEHPEGLRQKALAGEAGINASSTSEFVTRLEDDGYLKRTLDETDKRATVLKLTEMGQVRAEEIRQEREEHFEVFFGKLTDEEKQTLSDILDKLMEE